MNDSPIEPDNNVSIQRDEQLNCREETKSWYVYMVRCKDNSYYTGITTDLTRRLSEHNSHKKGARYTRSRRPVELAYSEVSPSRSKAASREYQIKKLPISAKRELITTYTNDSKVQEVDGLARP